MRIAGLPWPLFGSRPVAAPLAAHLRAQRGHDRATPLDDVPFVAVDTELTGFDPRRHAMVAIGAVRLRGLCLLPGETFYSLVRPPRDVPRDASLIHGLTDAALAEAPDTAEALAAFLDFLGPGIVVGHHVDLDMAFFNAAARRFFGGELAAPCIDTLRLALCYEEKRQMERGGQGDFEQVDFGLPALVHRYGLPSFAAHDALCDAYAAAYLFLYLARKSARGRPLTLGGLWRSGRLWWR